MSDYAYLDDVRCLINASKLLEAIELQLASIHSKSILEPTAEDKRTAERL